MNGTHVRSKLKIRNRILAIAVAFLLLTLMIPNMSFAEEVNNEAADPVAETPTNALTIPGFVTDGTNPVQGAIVYAYQGVTKKGTSSETTENGMFFLPLDDDSIRVGDKVMLKVISNNYGFEIYDYTVNRDPVTLALKPASSTTIKPQPDPDHTDRHLNYTIEAYIDNVKQSSETYDNFTYFSYNLPAGGQLTMSDRAHLDYNYTNSNNQQIRLHIVANGKQWYKAYWWGIASDSGLREAMPVNQPYILAAGSTYTVAVNYHELTMLDFSSTSEHHDYFDIDYVKNGAPYVKLQQASFQNNTFAGATCKVCDDGKIEIFFDDTDPVYTYKVVGYITPVAKAGYKLANWTYNGQTLKAGDSFIAEAQTTMAFEAKYEVDAGQAPQTGDMTYIFVLALIALVAVSSVGALRFRKNR